MVGTGFVTRMPMATSEQRQLTEENLSLQRTLQDAVCSSLYLVKFPTGYIGQFEPTLAYRCRHTDRDCVAKRGFLGRFALYLRRTEAAYNGLDVEIAERCPSREVENE